MSGKTFLLISLAVPSAFAAPADDDHAVAVESFRRGTVLVQAGKLQDAVEAFREALQREPASVGARLDLADCYEKMGAPAPAWREYVLTASYAHKAADPREAIARASADTLSAQLLVLRLVGTPPPGIEMHVDGDPVAPEIVAGARLAIAPGHHRVVASAPGKPSSSVDVTGAAGEIRLVPIDLAPPIDKGAMSPVALSTDSPDASSPQRTWGFVVGGVGVAGIAVGTVFGAVALSKHSALESAAHDTSPGAEARFYADRSSAQTVAAVSTVGFVAGAAAAIAGVVLVVTAPRAPRAAWLRVGPGVGGGPVVVVGGEL